MKKLVSSITCLIAAVIAFHSTASAQLISDFSGGNPLSVGPGTAGFEFTVGAQPLTLATLAVFDEFGDGVLAQAHTVGLWTATGTLLGKAVVTQASATLVNDYFYVNLIAPITLQSGQSYRLAAQYADVDFDLARGNVPLANINVNNNILLKDAYLSSGSGFDFPDLNVGGANYGFFGPNAGFNVVPEPATYALITGLALIGFTVYRRYRLA